jgi:hypothetical protein
VLLQIIILHPATLNSSRLFRFIELRRGILGRGPPRAPKKAFLPRFLLKSELFLAHFQPFFEAFYDTFKNQSNTN